MMPRLALDIGELIGVVIFLIFVINAIRSFTTQRRQEKREQEEAQRRKAEKRAPASAPAGAEKKKSSDVEDFMEELARRSGRPVPTRPAPPSPRPAPPKPRPAPPVAHRPPIERAPPKPRVEPRPPVAPPPIHRLPEATAAPVSEAPGHRLDTHVIHGQIAAEPLVTVEALAAEEAAEQEQWLKDREELRRAVILREVLGPPRSLRRYRPRAW
jgi:hypothetical protein